MSRWDTSSIKRIIQECFDRPEYKPIIVTENQSESLRVFKIIGHCLAGDDYLTTVDSEKIIFNFENGSCIIIVPDIGGCGMERLNEDSLSRVLEHCSNYPEYRAVIVMDSRSRLREFLCSMREYLQGDDSILGISRAGIIKFKNGSYIRPVMCDSGARGLRAHEIIYDDNVRDVEVMVNIKKDIYHIDEDDSTSLNDFLGEFKIV